MVTAVPNDLRLVARALVPALALAACADRELAVTDPSNAPGQGAATVEVFLPASELDGWLDTTFAGFARPADAGFAIVLDRPEMESRALLRFLRIAHTLTIEGEAHPPREFQDARLIVRLDSVRSSVPAAGTLRLYEVEQAFDLRTADWTFAVDTPGGRVPWSEPGSALGDVLASVDFDANADTDTAFVGADTLVGALVLELGANSDLLLKAMSDTLTTHPGLVLALEAMGDVRLEFLLPSLRYTVQFDVEPDSALSFTASAFAQTFIFDPPVPDPGPNLALAGYPAARAYFQVEPPDSVTVDGERVALRGSLISRAELRLTSRPLPAPFTSSRAFNVLTFRVAADVREFGPKTPIGPLVPEGGGRVRADSLVDGDRFSVGLTSLWQEFARVPEDSVPPPIRFVIRADPEPVDIGNWTFAGTGEPGEPVLRIILTPRTRFELP